MTRQIDISLKSARIISMNYVELNAVNLGSSNNILHIHSMLILGGGEGGRGKAGMYVEKPTW